MTIFKYGRKSEVAPYDNLTEIEEVEFEIISKKEEFLRLYERILTAVMFGALVICVGLITYLTAIMAEAQTADMSAFENSTFAIKLYNTLQKNPGNVFFSPYSLQVALAMVYTGATGNTAAEIQKTLAFSENKDNLMKAVHSSSTALKSSKDVTLNTANGVFLQQDYAVKDAFVKSMKTAFEAEAKTVDFVKSAVAAGVINSFVKEKTNGKIPELFDSDAFSELTKLVLVNAIYFKGNWLHQFDAADTEEDDFYLNNKDKVRVPFMTITKNFNSGENDVLNANIVELPYSGDLRMVLIVPKEIEGLKHVENNLKNVDLKTMIRDTTSFREIKLKMPKFKLEHKMDLNEPLKELGMKEMFSARNAQFGGITDNNDLYVSKVVQKAFIEVNEQGSEAAAATGVKFLMRGLPIPPDEITVNCPFLFFVTHVNGQVLFAGRVAKL